MPAVVDLAAMRDAMAALGGDPPRINPLVPVDLVIDHSIQVDPSAGPTPSTCNAELEFERNRERYEFLRWGQQAFAQLPGRAARHRHLPPGQPRVPGPGRVLDRDGWPSPTRSSAPTRHTPDGQRPRRRRLGRGRHRGRGGHARPAHPDADPQGRRLPAGRASCPRAPPPPTSCSPSPSCCAATAWSASSSSSTGRAWPPCRSRTGPPSATCRRSTAPRSPSSPSTTRPCATCGSPAARPSRWPGRGLRQGAGPVARPGGRAGLLRDRSSSTCRRSCPASPGRPAPRTACRSTEAKATASGLCARRSRGARPTASPTASTRRRPSPSRPATRRPDAGQHRRTASPTPTAGDAAERRAGDRATAVPVTAGRRASERRRSTTAPSSIAAITCCTNTSNPSVMLAAGLLAQQGGRAGPAPQAVGEDLARPRLQGRHGLLRAGRAHPVPREARLPPRRLRLHHLHRQLGSAARRRSPRRSTRPGSPWCAVLSGNRNFEGRINPDVRMNYLASPPLVVAYALAGTMDIDLVQRAARHRHRRRARVPARHLADHRPRWPRPWPSARRSPTCSARTTARCSPATSRWQALPVAGRRPLRAGTPTSTYIAPAPVLRRHAAASPRRSPTSWAPGSSPCSATPSPPTTSRPAGTIRADSPAGRYLQAQGVDAGRLQLRTAPAAATTR